MKFKIGEIVTVIPADETKKAIGIIEEVEQNGFYKVRVPEWEYLFSDYKNCYNAYWRAESLSKKVNLTKLEKAFYAV